MLKRIVSVCVALAILLWIVPAGAAPQGQLKLIFDAVTINATATSTSAAIDVKSSGVFGIYYIATSATGTADVKLEVLMCPTIDGTYVEPDYTPDITSSTSDEVGHVDSIYPPPMRYMKIKCTGVGSNAADSLITAYLFRQE